MFNNKLFIYLLLTGLFVVSLVVAFQPANVTVDSVHANYAPMKVTLEEEGKTRVIEHFLVTAPVNAYLQRINFNEGDRVRQGQVLMTLEPLPSAVLDPRGRAQAQASLGAAQALEKIIEEMSVAANADKELANITLTRTRQLRTQKAVSQNDLDVAKAEKRRADAIFRASQFTSVFTQYLTRMSRSALDYEDSRQSEGEHRHFTVKSVTHGTILKLADKSERVVKMGTVLMEIGDIEQIEVAVDVLSTLAVQLQAAMPVEILRWGEEQVLHGVIKRIEPSGFTKVSALGVEEQRVTVIVEISSDYSQRKQLGHGFRVDASFILWQSAKVLQIPVSALFRVDNSNAIKPQNEWAVYVINANKLEKRTVKIGHRNTLMVEVSEGLVAGEQLVSYLANDLQDGMSVTLR